MKDSPNLKPVFVVIPTYNGNSEYLRKTIASVLSQKNCLVKVMVIDDCSESPAVLPTEFYGKYEYVKNTSRLGLSGTLNRALHLAKSDFLLVLEDDIELLSDSYLEIALKHFDDPSTAVVTGRAVPKGGLSIAHKAFAIFDYLDYLPSGPISISYSLLKADVMRVSALMRVQGFTFSGDRGLGLEDQTLGYRLLRNGYNIVMEPRIVYCVQFGRSESSLGVLRKESLYGRTLGYAVAKRDISTRGKSHLDRLRIRHRMIQVGATVFIIISVAVSIITMEPFFISIPVTLLWIYYFFRSLKITKKKEVVLLPFVGCTMAFVFGSSFLAGLIGKFIGRKKNRYMPNS